MGCKNNQKYQQRIDSRFMGIEKKHTDFFFKPLNDEIALEKVSNNVKQGVEFFYEIIIYSILITLPMYEMYQSSVDSKEKSKQLQNQMNVIKGILLVLRAINSGNETNI